MSTSDAAEDPIAKYLHESVSGEVIFDLTTFQAMCRTQPSNKFGSACPTNDLRRLLYKILLQAFASTRSATLQRHNINNNLATASATAESSNPGDQPQQAASGAAASASKPDVASDENAMLADALAQVRRWINLSAIKVTEDAEREEVARVFATEAREMINLYCTSSSAGAGARPNTGATQQQGATKQCTRHMAEVCGPLLTLLPPTEETEDPSAGFDQLFTTFSAIMDNFAPQAPACNTKYADCYTALFRLLLQYHEPTLSMHLDHHNVPAAEILCPKMLSILAVQNSAQGFEKRPFDATILEYWDWLLLYQDPLITVFSLLRLLTAQSHNLIALRGRESISAMINTMTLKDCGLSMKDLVSDAIRIAKNTPSSVKSLFKEFLFNAEASSLDPVQTKAKLMGSISLPIHSSELIKAFSMQKEGEFRHPHLNYIVLDCRSEKSFNFARLPTALHVGPRIGFDPQLLREMLDRFVDAKGSHFCILGTGRPLGEETNLLQVIALQFITHGYRYVGIVEGGFKALIPAIKSGEIEFTRSAEAEEEANQAKQRGQKGAESAPGESIQKAANEAAAIAAHGIENAKSWGLGLINKVKTQVAKSTAPQQQQQQQSGGASGAKATSSSQSSAAATQQAQQRGAARTSADLASRKEVPSAQKSSSAKKQAPPANSPVAQQQQSASKPSPVFTMSQDDDDEDFDLITTVTPTAPKKETSATDNNTGAAAGATTESSEKQQEQEVGAPAGKSSDIDSPLYGDYQSTTATDATVSTSTPQQTAAARGTTTTHSSTAAVPANDASSSKKTSSAAGTSPHPFDDLFGFDDD